METIFTIYSPSPASPPEMDATMAAPKITHGQIAHPATSIIAPPPAHLPPPSYEEISNSRPPPAYVDPNPNTSPAPHVNQARAVLTQEPPQEQPYPHWVRRNLSIATFTVFFMILVAIPHLIFACIVAKDLHDEYVSPSHHHLKLQN
jgi:hypothetical protein